MKEITEKELKEIIKDVMKSSKLEEIGQVSEGLYYLGSGCYTGKKGW